MYHIIYASQSPAMLSQSQLENYKLPVFGDITGKKITGLLIYSEGYFLGVIEGNKRSVTRLWNLIEKDERHSEIICISKGSGPSRHFKDWTLIYRPEHLCYKYNYQTPGIVYLCNESFFMQILLNLHAHYKKLHPDTEEFYEELQSNFALRLQLLNNGYKVFA